MSERSLFSDAQIRKHSALYFAVLGLLAALFAFVFIFPLYWMVTGSVKDPAELALPAPTLIPRSFHPEVYPQAWNELRIGHYFMNTAFYAFGGWLAQIIASVTAAYAFSKLRPMLGNAILGAMLASLLLPATALLVPSYLTVSDVPLVHVNLLNTPWALWLPGAASAFNVYVLKQFFDEIPEELLDAARIDGAGQWRILISVVLPLSRPVLAVVSIFAVVGMWKDFLWPLLVLQEPSTQTLSVALSRLSATGRVPLTLVMAGLVIASVPMIAAFLVFQRSILRGLAAGSLKG